MRLSLVAMLVICSSQLFANENIVSEFKMPFDECFPKDSYISGEECYLNHNKPEYKVTGWQFLEVPINYQNLAAGKTKISYRLSSNFSLDKKTMIYFNGGPGGASVGTDFNLLDDVNVIYLNQRGAGFSRPETKDLFLNQDYYSSENTARDALEIIKHLGISQVTAYGMSYGTVPATIFGSLFKQYTRNVILEGVVFDGQSRLWYGSHRIKILQRYFDRLDPKLKENVLKYSRHPEIFAGWFSSLAQQLMYDSNFDQKMTSQLREIFYPNLPTPEEKEKHILEMLRRHSYNEAGSGDDLIYFSPTMFNFIACKELNAKDELSTFYAVFNEKNKLIPFKKDLAITNYCEKLGITQSVTYSAPNYPIEVPVYYLQGTTDGATTAEYAIWHYKPAAKGHAHLVLAKQVGHAVAIQHLEKQPDLSEEDKKNPLIVAAIEKKKAIQNEIVKVFKAAINSEALHLEKLNELIADKKSAWVMTAK